MSIYLDTSSLIKLYFFEQGTEELDKFFEENQLDEIYLSEISKTEFSSAIYKKVRINELKKEDAIALIEGFNSDYHNYSFIEIRTELIEHATRLIAKYGSRGLRTLDAIQLASIIMVKKKIKIGISSDKLLKGFFKEEGINCEL